MKIIKSKFFFVIICLFEAMHTFAAPNPPHPPNPNKSNGPPPPGLPIDMDVYLVFILAILYGIYIIYSHQLKTKTPI